MQGCVSHVPLQSKHCPTRALRPEGPGPSSPQPLQRHSLLSPRPRQSWQQTLTSSPCTGAPRASQGPPRATEVRWNKGLIHRTARHSCRRTWESDAQEGEIGGPERESPSCSSQERDLSSCPALHSSWALGEVCGKVPLRCSAHLWGLRSCDTQAHRDALSVPGLGGCLCLISWVTLLMS